MQGQEDSLLNQDLTMVSQVRKCIDNKFIYTFLLFFKKFVIHCTALVPWLY